MHAVVPSVTVHQVIDPDLLVAGIRGADLEPCQLSRHSAPSTLARVVWPALCLDMVRLGPAMLFSGGTPHDCFTLIFVLACPKTGHSFNFSIEHTDGYMGFFPPGAPIDATTPEGYTNATLTIPAVDFQAALAQHYPDIPETILARGAGMRVGLAAQTALRALLALVETDVLPRQDSLPNASIRQHLASRLLAVFLSALRSGCENLIPPPTPRVSMRQRRMRAARDFIASHLHHPLYLHDLCGALHLTPGAVEHLFRDLLGVSPITYLRHQRLHGVRRALKAAKPSFGIVKQVALEWGFWHLGRFSAEYRAFFGEKPSETLH